MLAKYTLILLILLFPFGQLTKIPLFGGSGSLYLHDLLIMFYILVNSRKTFGEEFLKNLIHQKALTGFILSCVLSLILALSTLPTNEILISFLYLLRFIAYILFIYILRHDEKLSNYNFKPYLIASIILNLILGFGQYFIFPSLEPLFAAGWDRHLDRLVGTWLDSGFTGLILVLQLIYLIDNYIKNNNGKNLFLAALILLSLIAILLTYSRSSYLALIAALGMYAALKKIKKVIFLFIFLLIIGMLFLPRTFGEGTNLLRTSTISSRLGSWQQGIDLFLQKPVFGHGFNTLRYVKRDQNLEGEKWGVSHAAAGIENSFIFLLATTGIMGTAFFGWWFWNVLNLNRKNAFFMSSIMAIAMHGMFANSWFYPWVILWMGNILYYYEISSGNNLKNLSK